MKNETTTLTLLHIYRIFYFVLGGEICCNTSPEYGGRYCIMDDFDGLTFYDIVSVFANPGVSRVPPLKIDVNVVITNRLPALGLVGGDRRFGLFPCR